MLQAEKVLHYFAATQMKYVFSEYLGSVSTFLLLSRNEQVPHYANRKGSED